MIGVLWDRIKRFFLYNEMRDVRDCHEKFGILATDFPVHLTKRKLQERVDFLCEEVQELQEALHSQDLMLQADALIDIVYVAKGTAVMMGLPWEDLWMDVQRANMQKERGVGKRGHQVDLVKPKGWVPPQTGRILIQHGYDPLMFTDCHGNIIEGQCYDDDIQPVER